MNKQLTPLESKAAKAAANVPAVEQRKILGVAYSGIGAPIIRRLQRLEKATGYTPLKKPFSEGMGLYENACAMFADDLSRQMVEQDYDPEEVVPFIDWNSTELAAHVMASYSQQVRALEYERKQAQRTYAAAVAETKTA